MDADPKNIFSITWFFFKGLAQHCSDRSIRVGERIASFQLQLSLLVYFIGISWFWLSANYDGLGIESAFERSGSVLVLVAIYLDYSYRESAVAQISRSMRSSEYRLLARYMINLAVFIRPFAIFSGILGTLIWGYGSQFHNT